MPVGRSLHVGINEVSPAFPNARRLRGAERDAQAMYNLACARNFEAELIPASQANHATVITKLLDAAHSSKPGDIFLFTFAGHGTGESDDGVDEDDGQDEALVLTDVLLFDDELRLKVWPEFKKDVRVLMIADSCHSGTVAAFTGSGIKAPVMREISSETRERHLKEYRQFYRQLVAPVYAPIEANVLLLAACGDFEKTPDGFPHGEFTQALLNVINTSSPANYRELIDGIAQLVGPQRPVLTPLQPVSEDFIRQRPFTI
jgi:hypothetical protein